jgi:hypothetical protein
LTGSQWTAGHYTTEERTLRNKKFGILCHGMELTLNIEGKEE